MSRTHKTENCKNVQKIQEARHAETRALRTQGEIVNESYGTDSDKGDVPGTHIGKVSWADFVDDDKDDDEDKNETAEQAGGEMN